jgi:hypothetical protein
VVLQTADLQARKTIKDARKTRMGEYCWRLANESKLKSLLYHQLGK